MSDTTARRLLVLADRDVPAAHDPAFHAVAAAVAGHHARVVAPAGPVPGERWIVDLEARERAARERLAGWIDALAAHAGRVDGEVGDEHPGLALADARHGFPADGVVTPPREEQGAPVRGRRARRPVHAARALRPVAVAG